jgi:hypothetical protein
MKRYRRTNVLAVFCALTSVFLILYGCGGGGGDSAPSVTVPSAPSNLIANAGDNSVTLSWSPVAGATSYNIYRGTAPGVTKTNGTKVSGVQSPNTVSGLTNGTAYFFVVAAENAAGESGISAEKTTTPFAPSAAFSQADLTGTWDVILFNTGSNSGWLRVTANTDGSGGVTVTSLLDSKGNTTLPAPGSFTWTISAAGVVSEGGVNGNSDFHGQMSSNKQLVIGKEVGTGSRGSSVTLRVFRKRPVTPFSNADLANKTLTVHWLDTGTDNTWGYGAGTIDGSGLLTQTSQFDPSGPRTPSGSVGTLSVSSAGIVTLSVDNTFHGLMTDDKKVIFYIVTSDINDYEFGVITITGQTYTQSDYAGMWNFSMIRNNVPNPGWNYGVTSVDAAGNGTYLSYTEGAGGAAPANFVRVLSASGVVTDPADATYNGQLSYNKDISVHTNTSGSGRYGLTIGFK